MSHTIHRRTLIKSTAGLGVAGLAGPMLAPSLVRAVSPNGKLRHACIGSMGMMGPADRSQIAGHPKTEIAALCDVDTNFLNAAGGQHPSARKYTDWRELFAAEGDKIDSINVTVPDHMHASIAMTAIRAGKHVYCQKPMCHDVSEVRALTIAAKKAGVVTQLGTQAACNLGDRMSVHYLREGVLGKIKHLVTCSNRPGAIDAYRLVGPRPKTGSAPPAHLNWDLWLGTAPTRAFSPGIYHTAKWRAWQDFGTGWLGDIGCHVFNAPWKGLGLTAPKSVIATVQESWRDNPARRGDTWPQSGHITWIFPGNALTGGEDLKVEWYDGLFYPPDDVKRLNSTPNYPPESFIAIGEGGAMLQPNAGGPRLLPREKYKAHPRPDLKPTTHWANFVDACLGATKVESPFSVAGPMTETILLGTIAERFPGEKLEWNAAEMKITNHAEANALLRRTYRDGWAIDGL